VAAAIRTIAPPADKGPRVLGRWNDAAGWPLLQRFHSSFLAFLNTLTIMEAVSLPVLVFWRLG